MAIVSCNNAIGKIANHEARRCNIAFTKLLIFLVKKMYRVAYALQYKQLLKLQQYFTTSRFVYRRHNLP